MIFKKLERILNFFIVKVLLGRWDKNIVVNKVDKVIFFFILTELINKYWEGKYYKEK